MDAELAKQVINLKAQGLSARGVALYLYAEDDATTGEQLVEEAERFLGVENDAFGFGQWRA